VRALALFALALSLAACTQQPAMSSAGPDAGLASATCANLARLGCSLGSDPQCVSRVELAVSERRTDLAAVNCARGAATKPALAGCAPTGAKPYFECP